MSHLLEIRIMLPAESRHIHSNIANYLREAAARIEYQASSLDRLTTGKGCNLYANGLDGYVATDLIKVED